MKKVKKVLFTPSPRGEGAERSADQWVADRSMSEPTKRLTVDVPLSLHRRIKVQCAVRGEQIADVVRELLEKRFPEEYAGS